MLPYGDITNLDEDTQRRIVLQAAKQSGPDVLRDLRRKQPTLKEVDSEISTNFWVCFIGGFFLFFPWIILPFVVRPLWKVRQAIRKDWRLFLAVPDAECEHLALAGAIRREIKRLPRPLRRSAREIARELDRIDQHCR